MNHAFLVDGIRTPIGNLGGSLSARAPMISPPMRSVRFSRVIHRSILPRSPM